VRRVVPILLALLVSAAASLSLTPAARAQTRPDSSLLGDWSGAVSYAGETMHVGLRFKVVKDTLTGMLMDIPEMKLHDVGPFRVDRQPDGQYSSYIFTFAESPDGGALSVQWSFDGHDLAFELEHQR